MAYVYGATRRKRGTAGLQSAFLNNLNKFYREYGADPDPGVLKAKLGYRSRSEYMEDVKRYNVAGYVQATDSKVEDREPHTRKCSLRSKLVADFLYMQAPYHTVPELRTILLKELGLRVTLEGLRQRLEELEIDYQLEAKDVVKPELVKGTAKKPKREPRVYTFTVKEDKILTRLYPYLSNSILRAHFLPNKPESAILSRARKLGIAKAKSGRLTQKDFLGIIIAVQQGLGIADIIDLYPKFDPGLIKVLYPYIKKLV